MTALQQAIAAIEDQQKSLSKYSMAYTVGEQLKDIISTTPRAAEIVLDDLAMKGMGIVDCEKKIEAFAREHKEGNRGCCPPTEADRIIRDFYGLPDAPPKVCTFVNDPKILAAAPSPGVIAQEARKAKRGLASFMRG